MTSADGTLASIEIERRVEWPDTDAAGHHHHSAVVRWMESAEGALLRALDRPDLFGVVPRVHYEVDYRARLYFGQLIRITIAVAEVGRSSLTYVFTVRVGDEIAAEGRVVVVHTGAGSAGSEPWDDDIRAKFLGAGPQTPERFQRLDI